MPLLFVYGTLKRGQKRQRLLRSQEFLRDAVTLPRYRLVDCGAYPGLVEVGPGGGAIHGELWRVEDALFAKLDHIEEAPELFRHGPVAIESCDEPVVAYFYQRDPSDLPDCGEFWP